MNVWGLLAAQIRAYSRSRRGRASSAYDKTTLGPGCGRGSGVRAWQRWHRQVAGGCVAIRNPDKFLHAAARRRKGSA